ncbi:hypothetical protein DZK27_07175 [Rhodobacteraceae bacterium 63075]|nr:hypothetical protein DZK27_07175 [Rhodobacteraceae bacterium 63075]
MDGEARNRSNQARWHSATNYSGDWIKRNRKLFGLFMDAEYVEGQRYRVAEIGCGANKPMEKLLSENKAFEVQSFDLVDWDGATEVIDLNKRQFEIEGFDIATFCGVLEYINDWPALLPEVMERCDYMLLSYAFVPKARLDDDLAFIAEIRKRTKVKGWRSHRSAHEFINMVSQAGVISHCDIWRNHMLVVVRNFAVDHKA